MLYKKLMREIPHFQKGKIKIISHTCLRNNLKNPITNYKIHNNLHNKLTHLNHSSLKENHYHEIPSVH